MSFEKIIKIIKKSLILFKIQKSTPNLRLKTTNCYHICHISRLIWTDKSARNRFYCDYQTPYRIEKTKFLVNDHEMLTT